MKQSLSTSLSVVLLVLDMMGSNTNAATVTYTLDLSVANQWEVRASSSIGDNGGMTTYGIPLLGSVLTLDRRSPNVFKLGPNGNSGFTNLRSFDLPTGGANPSITGQQDLVTPNLVYGFGQTPGAFTGVFFPNESTSDTAWTAPLVIARGVYNMAAGTLQFNGQSENLVAHVFDNGTGNERIAASVATQIIPFGTDYNSDGSTDAADYVAWRKLPGLFGGNPDGYNAWWTHFGEPATGAASSVPEPSAITLFGLAMLGIGLRRRR